MATVLYVDDQEAISRAVKQWLSRKGHVVYVADTLAAARRVISSERLDGIFIDLRLGSESGLDLYRWTESLDAELAHRVAFVTGDLFDEDLAAARLDLPVFTKPFELSHLEAIASRWQAGAQGPPEQRGADAGSERVLPGR